MTVPEPPAPPDDFDPKLDALATYHEACRLARKGDEAVRAWFKERNHG